MVADDIPDGNAHVLAVHLVDMGLEPLYVADIPCVDDKGRAGFVRDPPQKINPGAGAAGSHFAVCHL